MRLSQEEIKAIIPHREPFLLIDEIVHIDEKSAEGHWHLSGEEYFFAGHFPGNPVLPGVLAVESMAQVGAVIALSLPRFAGKTPYFTHIEKARFRRKIVPGDTLRLCVELTRISGMIGKGLGKAFVGDELAVECEIIFVIG